MPYYSRKQIEIDKVLEGRGLEIAWLKDPVDADILQIQGSGRLKLPDGRTIRVGYAAKNGLPYRAIGRFLWKKGLLKREKISMQAIRKYLSEHPKLIDEVLNYDPSYVFFNIMESGPYGNINVQLTPGRSMALDARLFPKGALCFISTKKPVIDASGRITRWVTFSRFVLNQDTGGAIKGAGRADIFWGNDNYAQIAAGHMKQMGKLFFLVKK